MENIVAKNDGEPLKYTTLGPLIFIPSS